MGHFVQFKSYIIVNCNRKLFTRSKTNEALPIKSRRVSELSNLVDSVSVVQLTQPGLLVENLIKKEDGSEKKKTGRKKRDNKEDKMFSNDKILTPVNIEYVPFDKNTPVVVGDNLIVYYRVTTYEAKVISMCNIEGVMKYYVHYKGLKSGYDEWIDVIRIAYKIKELEPGLEVDNADSSKSSPPEQTNVDPKKVLSISCNTRSSDLQFEVLDLSVKPPTTPLTNIFSVPGTNNTGKTSLFDPNFPSCSYKYFYNGNIPSTSISVYNSDYDVNSVLICEETITGSPTGMSEEQYQQEERKKALQALYEEREAASARYAMNQSFCRPMKSMGATKEEIEEYTNILKK